MARLVSHGEVDVVYAVVVVGVRRRGEAVDITLGRDGERRHSLELTTAEAESLLGDIAGALGHGQHVGPWQKKARALERKLSSAQGEARRLRGHVDMLTAEAHGDAAGAFLCITAVGDESSMRRVQAENAADAARIVAESAPYGATVHVWALGVRRSMVIGLVESEA